MLKRCSNCKHCIIDLRALSIGVLVHKCTLKKRNILRPFWSGRQCDEWRADDGK